MDRLIRVAGFCTCLKVGLLVARRKLFSSAVSHPSLRHLPVLGGSPSLSNFRQSVVLLFYSSIRHGHDIRNTKKKLVKPVGLKTQRKMMKVITVWKNMSVAELAAALNQDIDHVFSTFEFVPNSDKYDSAQSVIDNFDVIKDTVAKSGMRWQLRTDKPAEDSCKFVDASKRPPPDPSIMVKRPPVVTIMGHVDHGKTTLLDALRQTNVVATEFGGITQHIGAFSVQLESGETITFLDTPGHAAFSAMRARGAMVTDIVVLVVAADDGVMKQTMESIQHAKEAGVPIIVAINKIDKSNADIDRTKRMLLENGLQLEEFGGDIQSVPISALKGTNLDQLQESILALAEILECKADYHGPVEATVVESKIDVGRGKLSTALVQRGTLKKGSVLVAGTAWAKVRGMFNDKGRPAANATPGMPVEVIGWKELPSAGDLILEVETEQRAKEIVEWRQQAELDKKSSADLDAIRRKADTHNEHYQELRRQRMEQGRRAGAIFRKIRNKETTDGGLVPQLAIVVKGDVDGSLEAILDIIDSYKSPQCQLHLLNYGVGNITEQDVEMAAAFSGVIYGFNVVVPEKVSMLAKSKNVKIKMHNIIYRLVEDLQERLTEQLPAVDVEVVTGEANVLAQFTVTEGKRKVTVAGCRCVKGILMKKNQFKLMRNGEVLHTGDLSSLKHFKNEVESIKNDVECGLSFADTNIIPLPGDSILCFETKQQKQELDWELDF